MTEKNRQKPEKTSGKIASLSGLQERLHFGSNLTVVGAKPEQVTLSWRKEEFGVGDLVRCIRRMAGVFRPIIFALKNQGRSGNPAEISALMVDIMQKA